MHVHLQGRKIAFEPLYEYRLYVDDKLYDSFITKKKLTAEEMVSVENGYSEALDGYALRGIG